MTRTVVKGNIRSQVSCSVEWGNFCCYLSPVTAVIVKHLAHQLQSSFNLKVRPHKPRAQGNGGRLGVALNASTGHVHESQSVDHVSKPNQEPCCTQKSALCSSMQ